MASSTSPLDDLQTYISHLLSRVSASFNGSLSSLSTLSLQDYIRLIAIIGGYCLLRPYLLKLSGRFQARDHERKLDADEASSAAAVNPNARGGKKSKDGLLGQVEIPEDSDSEDEQGGTGADWGKGARRRQRAMLRKLLDEEEERKVEEEEGKEDKDIEEFLVD